MYKGLPIITNKISTEEQRGIPHHLLGHISLAEKPWSVKVFKEEASKIIEEIRAKGKLPIVVGGSHYYINGLLFEDNLVDDSSSAKKDGSGNEDTATLYPILEGSTEAMLTKLREVDPTMAARWHPNDRRKIRRSLEIFLTTGRRASEIYTEQQVRKETKRSAGQSPSSASTDGSWDALLFWVYSKPEVLQERLDKRVDKMVESGLVDETSQIYDYLLGRLAAGDVIDQTTGIWQSIGFKQFEPYLAAVKEKENEDAESDKLKSQGIADTQSATRRYSKSQVRWVTMKTLPLLRDEGALDKVFLLDSTDINRWSVDVLDHADGVTRKFLEGQELPPPASLSATAKQVLTGKLEASSNRRQETPCNRTCEMCHTTLLTEEKWRVHLTSRRHRSIASRKKRKSLVPIEQCPPTSLISVLDTETDDAFDLSFMNTEHPP
jgi:tRNA dimethylallyltransferase